MTIKNLFALPEHDCEFYQDNVSLISLIFAQNSKQRCWLSDTASSRSDSKLHVMVNKTTFSISISSITLCHQLFGTNISLWWNVIWRLTRHNNWWITWYKHYWTTCFVLHVYFSNLCVYIAKNSFPIFCVPLTLSECTEWCGDSHWHETAKSSANHKSVYKVDGLK